MRNKTLRVAGYEFRKTVRKKGFIFIAVIVPFLLVAAVFVVMPLLPEILGAWAASWAPKRGR